MGTPLGDGTTTRERILRVAAELYADNGYHATGMSELCEAASVGRGALYYHFDSKEALLYEISCAHVVDLVAFGEELLDLDSPALVKIERLSRRLLATIADNLPELTVFFREIGSLTGSRYEELVSLRSRFERIWEILLEQGEREGSLRAHSPLTVKALLGMHNYSYLWLDPSGKLRPREIADLFLDIALNGLMAPEHERWEPS